MVLIPQVKRVLISTTLAEVLNRLDSANRKLREEQGDASKLKQSYKDGLDASAKNDIKEAYQLLYWLGITHFSFPDPIVLDNDAIDLINPRIRQVDDGLL